MILKNHIKLCLMPLICTFFGIGVLDVDAVENVDSVNRNISNDKSPLYEINGSMTGELDLTINDSEFYSSSQNPKNYSGGVIYSELANISIKNSSFHDIISNSSGGSVIYAATASFITEITGSSFSNNGIVINTPSEWINAQGGAIYTDGLNMYEIMGSSVPLKSDIGEIANSEFYDNYIDINVAGDGILIDAIGGAITSGTIAYDEANEALSPYYLLLWDSLMIDYSQLQGGIIGSTFTNNRIQTNITSGENGRINNSGAAVESYYIRKIENSNFDSNSVLSSVNTTGTATVSTAGGVISTSGLSEILNSNFTNNIVNQSANGDMAFNTVSGGIISSINYDLGLLSDSNFNNNSIIASSIGNEISDVLLIGGILSNYAQIYDIQNSSFSLNNFNLTAGGLNSNMNVQGGILYADGIDRISNVSFNNNSLNISSGEYTNLLGGAIYTQSYLSSISDSSFTGNKISITSNANDSNVNVNGALVYSQTLYDDSVGIGSSGIIKSIENVSGTNFNSNSLTVNSSATVANVNIDGGVLASDSRIDNIENSNFNSNILTVNTQGNSSEVNINGAVVSTPAVSRIVNTGLKNNSAIIKTNAPNAIVDVKGGGIYISDSVGEITGSTFEKNTIQASSEGESSVLVSAKGGAFYLQGNSATIISNSSFTENSVSASGENSQAHGGAIYNNNDAGLTLKDTDFKNNSASKGGAIYSAKNLDIIADTKNIEFFGNSAAIGADLYIDNSTANLITNSKDRYISLNSGLALGGDSPAVNLNGEGSILLNTPVVYEGSNYGRVNVNGNTTLKPSVDSNLSNAGIKLTLNDNATLDVMNNQGSQIELYDMDVTSDNVNLKMDVNLDGSQSDYFNLNSSSSGSTGKINITQLNILSDSSQKSQDIKVTSSDIEVDADIVQYTNNNKYVITQSSTEKDKINVLRENDSAIDGFAQAIVDTNASSFNALDNVTTDLSINGNELTHNLYVSGNNKSIDFSSKDNINITNSSTLTLDNISELKNSSSALNVGTASGLILNSNSTDTIVNSQLNLDSDTSYVEVNLDNGKSVTFSDRISGTSGSKGTLSVLNGNANFSQLDNVSISTTNSNVNLNQRISNSDFNAVNSTVNIYDEGEQVNLTVEDSVLNINSPLVYSALNAQRSGINLVNDTYINGSDLTLNNSAMAMLNNNIGTMQVNTLNLQGQNNITVDVDMSTLSADKINADTVNAQDGSTLNVSQFNIVKNSIATGGEISITDNPELKAHTSTTVSSVDNGVYTYGVNRTSDGNFMFNVLRYDPAVIIAPMAQQAMLATQLNTYNQAFANMDMIMLKPYAERMAARYSDRLAINDSMAVREYLNHYREYHRTDYEKGPWFRPYGSIENIRFNNGPKIYNYMYGSVIGFDSNLIHHKNGADSVYSGYVSYNGSIQDYDSARIHQNGATVGATASVYKRNFFTGLTLNGSISVADASSSHGKEDFTMVSAGVASKTGFNFETNGGAFIFQPSLLMSYTFVNNPDYTNATGLRIKSDVLNALQLEPGANFIFNFENNLQAYLGAGVVFTIMGKSDFMAADTALPALSFDPYGQYRLGIQKRWGERSLGFAQTTLRSGGRNGAGLQLGLRYAI